MTDLIWLGIILGMTLLGFLYLALLGDSGFEPGAGGEESGA
ncbi:hypothetical protein [Sphingosinicella terrae]|nr:hypothetical protein [Sphingosinicella terrae]